MSQPKKPFEIKGHHVLFAVIAFFTVVIGVNVFFLVLPAVRSFPGEIEDKSYYQGLNYNDSLADKARQADTGWRLLLLETPADAQGEVIDVKLVGPDGNPIYGAALTGTLNRPTTDEGLRELVFIQLSDGIYRAEVKDLPRGAWDLSLEARAAEGDDIQLEASTRLLKS